MTTDPTAVGDGSAPATRMSGGLQRKPEWSFQSWMDRLLDKIVLYPREIRGFDKAGAQRWVGAWSMAVARGVKDGTGDHLVVQGDPVRLLWIECKGETCATPAQVGTADAYERCGVMTVRECRTMAQVVAGLRVAGVRLHGNTDNLVVEYQERADAALRELKLRKGEPAPKKKRASRPRPAVRPSRKALRFGMKRMGL